MNKKVALSVVLTGSVILSGCNSGGSSGSVSASSNVAGPGSPGATSGSGADNTPPVSLTAPLIAGRASWVNGKYVWVDYAYDDRSTTPTGSYPTASYQLQENEAYMDFFGIVPEEPLLDILSQFDSPDSGVYPSMDVANAADLIKLQLELVGQSLKIQATLQTLTDPLVPLLVVGVDTDGNSTTGAAGLPGDGWKQGGTPLGLESLIVVDAGVTRILSWNGSGWDETVGSPPLIDVENNTIDVDVAEDRVDLAAESVRFVAAVGLASPGLSFLENGGKIYDLAFVYENSASNWQSNIQANILAGEKDAGLAVATVNTDDFVQRRTELAKPVAGLRETFLYRSSLELGEGIGVNDRKYAGPYQPYVVWFPEGLPANPPLVVFLHGAMSNHMSGAYGLPETTDDFTFGPESLGIVTGQLTTAAVHITPLGRGETFGWYAGAAEQDVLDAWADVQRRLGTDPERTVLTGYSLGGVGTFRLSQLYPDRLAGAVEMVGAPDLGALSVLQDYGRGQDLPNSLENLRNLPFRMAHSRADELEIIVGAIQPDAAALQLQQLGYDYRYWQFYLRDHVTFPVPMIQCEIEQAFVRRRLINPSRIVYSFDPAIRTSEESSGLALKHDSAYWVSGLAPRGTEFAPGDKATVDVTSLAMPDREPVLEQILSEDENISGGKDVCGENPDTQSNDIWTTLGQAWVGYEQAALSNGMQVGLTGVASVSLDMARMELDVGQPVAIQVQTDGDSILQLKGAWQNGAHLAYSDGSNTSVCVAGGVLEVPLNVSTERVVVTATPSCSQ